MSLIDTAVIGQGSSTELAALGTENLNVDECSNFVHYLDHHLINMQLWSLLVLISLEQVLLRLCVITRATCSYFYQLLLPIWLQVHLLSRLVRFFLGNMNFYFQND